MWSSIVTKFTGALRCNGSCSGTGGPVRSAKPTSGIKSRGISSADETKFHQCRLMERNLELHWYASDLELPIKEDRLEHLFGFLPPEVFEDVGQVVPREHCVGSIYAWAPDVSGNPEVVDETELAEAEKLVGAWLATIGRHGTEICDTRSPAATSSQANSHPAVPAATAAECPPSSCSKCGESLPPSISSTELCVSIGDAITAPFATPTTSEHWTCEHSGEHHCSATPQLCVSFGTGAITAAPSTPASSSPASSAAASSAAASSTAAPATAASAASATGSSAVHSPAGPPPSFALLPTAPSTDNADLTALPPWLNPSTTPASDETLCESHTVEDPPVAATTVPAAPAAPLPIAVAANTSATEPTDPPSDAANALPACPSSCTAEDSCQGEAPAAPCPLSLAALEAMIEDSTMRRPRSSDGWKGRVYESPEACDRHLWRASLEPSPTQATFHSDPSQPLPEPFASPASPPSSLSSTPTSSNGSSLAQPFADAAPPMLAEPHYPAAPFFFATDEALENYNFFAMAGPPHALPTAAAAAPAAHALIAAHYPQPSAALTAAAALNNAAMAPWNPPPPALSETQAALDRQAHLALRKRWEKMMHGTDTRAARGEGTVEQLEDAAYVKALAAEDDACEVLLERAHSLMWAQAAGWPQGACFERESFTLEEVMGLSVG